METTCSKTFILKINGKGKYTFPDLQILNNKTVTAIAFADIEPYGTAMEPDIIRSMSLSLTSDGYNYFVQDMTVSWEMEKSKLGANSEINRPLCLSKCYVTSNVGGTLDLTVTVFYKDNAFSHPAMTDKYNYETVEVYCDGSAEKVNFPDIRTLAGKRIKAVYAHFPYVSSLSNRGLNTQDIFVTLQKGSQVLHDQLPVTLLQQETFYEETTFSNIEFDCENSFIESLDGTKLSGSVCFTFKYER